MRISDDMMIRKAQKLVKRGQIDKATQLLEGFSKKEPANEKVAYFLNKVRTENFAKQLGKNPPKELQAKLKVLFDSKKWKHLIDACEPVANYFPSSVPVLNMLGVAYRETGDLKKARQLHLKSLFSDPTEASTYVNLTNSYIALGEFSEPLKLLTTYLASEKKLGEHTKTLSKIYDCLGNCLYYLGRYDEATVAYERAIDLDGTNDVAHTNLGAVNLAYKNFKIGWPLREYRRSRADFREWSQNITKPEWFGQRNAVVFCWAEQGLGDEVMAASCLNELSENMKKLIVAVDGRLVKLFSTNFPGIEFVSRDDDYHSLDFDCHIPSMTALGMMRQSEASFKSSCDGYLSYSDEKIDNYLIKLKSNNDEKPIVGITWKTEAAVTGGHRSIELVALLKAIPTDFTILNLQYGDCREEIELAETKLNRKIHQIDTIDNRNDIDALCALISGCNQVVTVDNSTVHFAGALGVQCQLLLPKASDYRWGALEADRCYWYESVKLLRQKTHGNWDEPIKRLTQNLQRH